MLGLPFACVPAMIDETPAPGLSPVEVALDLARRKALTVLERREAADTRWIFAADTIVVLAGELFGKPAGRDEARRMLGRLAGNRHDVITAMALHDRRTGLTNCRSGVCGVEFAPLSAAEIEWYLDTGEWRDAAGAYRLQEKGACLVKSVTGSPSAVVGLPLRDFYVMLRENGYPFGA